MKKLADLTLLLDALIEALRVSGKADSASFFAVKSTALRMPDTCAEAIRDLSTCAAIAQYGDFTANEEQLLGRVVTAAIEIKKG